MDTASICRAERIGGWVGGRLIAGKVDAAGNGLVGRDAIEFGGYERAEVGVWS